MVAKLIRLNWVQKLDKANIPNAKNLQDTLANVEFDPGRQFSLPWQSGFTGIGYNPKATGGKKIETYEQLLTDKALKGKVTLLTEMRDTVGMMLLAMGKDPAKFTDADFDAAIAQLKDAKNAGQLKGFTGNEYGKGLASGDIAACLAWTGDVVQLQGRQPDAGLHAARHRPHDLVGQLRDPQQGQAQEERRGADQLLLRPQGDGEGGRLRQLHLRRSRAPSSCCSASDPKVANNPLIFPSEAVLGRAHVFIGLTEDAGDPVQQGVPGPDHR